MIRKAIIIPKTIDTNDDDDDEMSFLFSIEDDGVDDNKSDEQRGWMEKIGGGGPILNIGGWGSNWEQRWHA